MAAQKLNLTTSPHRRKRHSVDEDLPEHHLAGGRGACGGCGGGVGAGGNGSFSEALHRQPPPLPPALLRRIGVREVTGVGKVKVMLKVCGGGVTPNHSTHLSNVSDAVALCPEEEGVGKAEDAASPAAAALADVEGAGAAVRSPSSFSFFSVDGRKKQVTLFDPAACGGSAAPEDRRVGVAAPKMFAFDAIFTQENSQTEICASALTDLIHAVINGTDGCLFCFGHSKLGKTCTMVGSPESVNMLGIIPCAISWLFRGINEQKQKTGARFSVRVSAVEIVGPSQHLKNLLADHATDSEQSPGVYLRDDPLFGTTLQNQSELRVPTAEKAAFYLDAALNKRTTPEEMRDSHMLYTLHIYQYSVAGKGGVAGGRSRLHLIDLGSCERGKANGGISLSGLGNVILAIFNGQKHLPYRDHKITQLLKECLSSLTCHAAMIVHVSPYSEHYTDTLATVQLASRIHRMRRRKIKLWGGSAGSGGSSGEEAARIQAQENCRSTGSSDVDPSSSEQSADTVIYVGPSDEATDGEHPPVYIPSLNSGDNRCVMSKALRGSSAEHRPVANSCRSHPGKSTHCSMHSSQKLTNELLDEGHNVFFHSSSNKINAQTAISKSLLGHVNTCKSTTGCVALKSGNNKSPENGNDSQMEASNKFSNYGNSNLVTVSGSDEQWIDGPRISKMKVAEAWNLLKDNYKKKETWIDGPMQMVKGHSNMSYGFMDSHKKNMIRKWVENQTVQIQKQTGKSSATSRRSNTQVTSEQQAKDSDQVNASGGDSEENQELKKLLLSVQNMDPGSSVNEAELGFKHVCNMTENLLLGSREILRLADGAVENTRDFDEIPSYLSVTAESSSDFSKRDNLKKADGHNETHITHLIRNENQRFNNVTQSLDDIPSREKLNIDVAMKTVDVRLQILQSQQEGSGSGEDDVEIIEVMEPCEPVPTQDCSLQVTEEDIAMCMGELENPLPEVDQESSEEHPLRILSEENLTVVSTFTDSLSVATDMDLSLPRRQLGITLLSNHSLPSNRPFSLCQLPENYITHTNVGGLYSAEVRKAPKFDINPQGIIGSNNGFNQLSRLHERYRNKLAKVNATKIPNDSIQTELYNHTSRYQSRSLIDMLHSQCYDQTKTDACYAGNSSIHSEPVCNTDLKTQGQSKICDNCKISLARTECNKDFLPLTTSHSRECLFHETGDNGSFRHRLQIPETCDISSLRHPDGASNPNLPEKVESAQVNENPMPVDNKIPIEEKKKQGKANVHRKGSKSTSSKSKMEMDDDLPPDLPPPLFVPISSRLRKRLFSKESVKLKSISSICPEGYDSGHDSSSPRPLKGSVFSLRFSGKVRPGCESSGYESIVRDSESSSYGSSQDSDHSSRADFHNSASFETVAGGEESTCSPGQTSIKVPVLQYFKEDVERLERRLMEMRGGKIRKLRKEQEDLKEELAAAKSRLLIPRNRWSYELHVEASMDHRHPSFVEALQRETEILRKRVEACKSHILMATCFDSTIKTSED